MESRRAAFMALALYGAMISLSPANANSLTFSDVLTDALANSFDLKISGADTNIKRADVKSKRADLSPQLRASYGTEYLRGLDDSGSGQAGQPVVVGSTVLPGVLSRNQNVVTLGANKTVFDAGAGKKEYEAARFRVDASRIQQQAVLRDIKLKLVDEYAEALLAWVTLQEKRRELELHRKAFAVKKRIFDTGKISRVELGERAIQVQASEDALQQCTQEYGDKLNRLSQLTHKVYVIEETRLTDLHDITDLDTTRNSEEIIRTSPEVRSANLEIRAAQSELSALKRQRFLQVGFYSTLVFYGSDEKSWLQSFGRMGPRQVNLGINVTAPIYDGGKNRAECQKKQFEIARLTSVRDKREWELRSEYDRLASSANQFGVELVTKAKLLKEGASQVSMVKQLTDSQIEEPQAYFDEQIAQLQKRLGEERTKVLRSAALIKMQIMSEG